MASCLSLPYRAESHWPLGSPTSCYSLYPLQFATVAMAMVAVAIPPAKTLIDGNWKVLERDAADRSAVGGFVTFVDLLCCVTVIGTTRP